MAKPISPKREFQRVEKMLYDLAWAFSNSYPIPFEDAKSEAYVGFMKACKNYKPNKGTKFSTWCRFVVWGQLKSHIMQRSGDPFRRTEEFLPEHEPIVLPLLRHELLTVAELTPQTTPREVLESLLLETPKEMLDLTNGLSYEAREILFLFLETPAELRGSKRGRSWKDVQKACFGAWWSKDRVEKARKELESRLLELFATT